VVQQAARTLLRRFQAQLLCVKRPRPVEVLRGQPTGSGRASVRTEFLNLLKVLLTHPHLRGARTPVLGKFRASLCTAYSVMRAR
jgi:hypothetical protein